MKIYYILAALIAILALQGCNRAQIVDPEDPANTPESGAYVLSEGSFSPGTATLSFYSFDDASFTRDIFNPGSLGLFPDGLLVDGNFLYVTEQGNFNSAGKIYKLDTGGTVRATTLFGLNPYSVAEANDKLYITNGPGGYVTVLNKDDLTQITTITVGVYPQEILSSNNRIYVCNTSEFQGAQDSTVTVIDSFTDNVIRTLTVQKDPSSFAVTNAGNILIGCPGQDGMIFMVDLFTFQKTDSFNVFGGFGSDIAVDRTSDNIYFISNDNNIVRLNLVTGTSNRVVTNSNPGAKFFYGYNYNYETGEHYVLNAKNFAVNGALEIYTSSGGIRAIYETGIAPKRVVFKYN